MSSILYNMGNFGGEVTTTPGIYKPSTSCKRYQTAKMGKRFFGLFCLTTWLSLTWSRVEASVPTCLSLSAACQNYGLDCQQRLPHCFMEITMHCRALLNDPTQPCPDTCNAALKKLVDLPVSGWLTCDCTGVMFLSTGDCLNLQNNLVKCSNYPTPVTSTVNSVAVAGTPGHVTPQTTRPPKPTCTAAKIVCDEVDSCQVALRNVLRVCDVSGSAIETDDDVCSMMCVKAMNKLEEQQTELWRCDCMDESGTVRGDSPMSAPWCNVFSNTFLEKCEATEERHVTYGPLSSPQRF